MHIISNFIKKYIIGSDDTNVMTDINKTNLLTDELIILNNVLSPIIVSNKQGIIIHANLHACKLFDYILADFIGKNVKCLCPSDVAHKHDNYIQRYNNSPNTKVIGKKGRKVIAIDKHGTKIPCLLGISNVQIQGNEYIMATFV